MKITLTLLLTLLLIQSNVRGQDKSGFDREIAKQTKYQPVVVNVENIEAILALLKNKFDKIYFNVERRRNGEVFGDIPELSTDSC